MDNSTIIINVLADEVRKLNDTIQDLAVKLLDAENDVRNLTIICEDLRYERDEAREYSRSIIEGA